MTRPAFCTQQCETRHTAPGQFDSAVDLPCKEVKSLGNEVTFVKTDTTQDTSTSTTTSIIKKDVYTQFCVGRPGSATGNNHGQYHFYAPNWGFTHHDENGKTIASATIAATMA